MKSIARTTQSIENMATSVFIHELCKNADAIGNNPINPVTEFEVFLQYCDMLEALATIVMATFEPAES